MTKTYPGMTVEISSLTTGCSISLFDGIFATGGITLSQVSIMTGLETYLIQNWVKRGFVSSPQRRLYSREQLARIVIINMLRDRGVGIIYISHKMAEIKRISDAIHACVKEKAGAIA